MIELIKSVIYIPLARAQMAQAGEVADQTQDQLTQLVGTILAKIPLWITAFIVIILTFIVARIVKASVENKMAVEGFEEEHKELSIVAGRSANAIVLTIGLTVGLKIAGIDLTTIIAAGAFGIGFALKDLIMNFIAGVMILTARHFTIGDIIKVNGILGKIEEIQSRATIVKNFDGTKVVVPNAELFVNPVTSFTSNPFRRVTVIVGVTYETDLKKAVDVCKTAAKRTRNVLAEPKPKVFVYEFGDSSVNIKVNVWVESKKGIIKVRNDLIYQLSLAFDEFGIEQPYPIYTIEFGNETGLVDTVKSKLEGKKSPWKKDLNKEAQLESHLQQEKQSPAKTAETIHPTNQQPVPATAELAPPAPQFSNEPSQVPVVTAPALPPTHEPAPPAPETAFQQPSAETPAVAVPLGPATPDWLKEAAEQTMVQPPADTSASSAVAEQPAPPAVAEQSTPPIEQSAPPNEQPSPSQSPTEGTAPTVQSA